MVSACEAKLGSYVPDRFIGGALPLVAGSVAPQDGYVQFTVWWTLIDVGYLNFWTDVIVF